MTPLHLILLEAIVLLIWYFIMDAYPLRYGRRIITIIVVACNIFLFPKFFYPEQDEEIRCGMPLLALNMLFCFVGNIVVGLTILVYIGYGKLMKR